MPTADPRFSPRWYLVVAFVEGACVMACELLGARMVAPYFGTTLFVWSSVIGVTLAALAIGYFLGGYLADRYTGNRLLFGVIAAGAVLIGLMPFSARFVMEATLGFGLRAGSVVSCAVFLLPPLACLGMTSPILIRLTAPDVEHAGRTSGRVYATSTCSGILSTFVLGFYLIPQWGVTWTVVVAAWLLGGLSVVYFLGRKRFLAACLLLGLGACLVLVAYRRSAEFRAGAADRGVVYRSAGLLGEVLVVDWGASNSHSSNVLRGILVNRQLQTLVRRESLISPLAYGHGLASLAAIKSPGSRALLLGLGGGSVAGELLRLGFEVDACELDKRIVHVARTWFGLDARCRVTIDDARHLVRLCQERYDVIIVDAFVGEQQPAHVLTLESVNELKGILREDGLLLINFSGFLSGAPGRGGRSILRTLQAAGLHAGFVATPGPEANRNLLFVASVQELDFSRTTPERQNPCCREIGKVSVPLRPVPAERVDLSDALLLRDDRPALEVINLAASESWRRSILAEHHRRFEGVPIF